MYLVVMENDCDRDRREMSSCIEDWVKGLFVMENEVPGSTETDVKCLVVMGH